LFVAGGQIVLGQQGGSERGMVIAGEYGCDPDVDVVAVAGVVTWM
jgi:hypothetical protein